MEAETISKHGRVRKAIRVGEIDNKNNMSSNMIVGKWSWWALTFHFLDDGTYTYVNSNSGVRTVGKYEVSDNIITFIVDGYVSTSEFTLQDDDTLSMRTKTPQVGTLTHFKRVS